MKGRVREKGKGKGAAPKRNKGDDLDEGDDTATTATGSSIDDKIVGKSSRNKRERKEERKKQHQQKQRPGSGSSGGKPKKTRGLASSSSSLPQTPSPAPSTPSSSVIKSKSKKMNGYIKRKLAATASGSNAEVIDKLPLEVWAHIVSFLLDSADLLNFRLACQHFSWFALIERTHFKVDASKCGDIEKLFDFLCNHCPRLHALELKDCVKMTELPTLPSSLHVLDLTGCTLLASAALRNLPPSLRELHLCNCTAIANEVCEYLPKELEVLNLSGCFNITAAAFPQLPRTLRSLCLKDCMSVGSLDDLPTGLRELELTWQLGGGSIESIQNLSELETLTLRDASCLKNSDAQFFPPSLRHLDIYQGSMLTDEVFFQLPPFLTTLQIRGLNKLIGDMSGLPRDLYMLGLSHNRLPDEGLVGLPAALHRVDLSCCHPVNSAILQGLPPDLQDLKLSWCRTLRSDALEFLPPRLKLLDLSECSPHVDDQGMQHLPLSLEVLDVVGVDNLTDTGLKGIATRLVNLKKLYLASRPPHISKTAIRNLPPKLEVVMRMSERTPVVLK